MRTWAAVVLLAACVMAGASAAPMVPASDDQVVETLPAGTPRGADRRLRRQWATQPPDAGLAVALARRHLDRARAQGDPREAGVALAALRSWTDPDSAPPAVLLLQATIEQHLHRFDAAAKKLERLVAREPQLGQAWLTLATIRRVQGRYADSDAACARVATAGSKLYAQACRAENDALRGHFGTARAVLRGLASGRGVDGATRGWLLTSLAELEERAGQPGAAEIAWSEALRADADPYIRIGFADFLIARGQSGRALDVLERLPASDAVLLRRAIAARRQGLATAGALASELRERIDLAGLRPQTQATHGRELAMFALWVDDDPAKALEFARLNVARQREPVDLWLLVQAARAAGRPEAERAALRLVHETGLRDRRIEGER
jgi:predicted Zn-dependent protease